MFKFIVAAIIVVAASVAIASNDSKLLNGVKEGSIQLECDLGKGYVPIDSSKVVDFYPDQGHWKFTNGGASQCKTGEAK